MQNALISTYTLPYLRLILKFLPQGSRIWLCTLSPVDQQNSPEHEALRQKLYNENIIVADYTYSGFGFRMALRFVGILWDLSGILHRHKIDKIHAWCTPGGAIGWILSHFSGKPLVLDSFEPHAESMTEAGIWKREGLAFKLLLWLEKKQLQRAEHVICAAPGMENYALKTYGIQRPFPFVKPASVNLEHFYIRHSISRQALPGISDGDIVCVYAGKFGGIYLEEETFHFFAVAAKFWPQKFRVLLLTSHSEQEIVNYCRQAGLDRRLLVRYYVPHEQVPRYMSLGNFGICPVKPIPTKKYCSPIKNGEYWALGLPVVITEGISTDSKIIEENNAGFVLRDFTASVYERALVRISAILDEPGHQERIRELAVRYRNINMAEDIYRAIYA